MQNLRRKTGKAFIGAALASVMAVFPLCGATAQDKIRIKLAHFLPTANGMHSDFMEPWARDLEACTDGQVEVTIYPGGTQLGNIAKLHDEVRAGIVDIAHGLHGIPGGRFERTRIIDLPFTAASADAATRTLWELYPDYLAGEYDGLKVLALHAHNPGQIHTTDKRVETIDDLKGLRLRFPSGAVKSMLEALGATPQGMPPGAVYENAQKGVIDGAAFTWDTMASFKLAEVMKHHLDAKAYVVSFWFTANRKAYESWPQNVRDCVDQLSGDNLIPKFGDWWIAWDKAGLDAVAGDDHEIITLDDEQRAEWAAELEPMIDAYLADLEDKGIENAREIHDKMKETAARYDG
ncbi:TRAP transporter substrate-binding protein [Labrenzia sp. 011]|uniref:TRAP transporter substrate-binding protein n=1 Tax=Labrenzia sp. 011 TaxID=2171494 RepID=UPI000D522A13|nr:TRAP transporter substrate-binding protein [Labrenzia sp. 011]PVB62418.1 C4-dicarboxylate ABC transporter [Labrenzia sp. 011]